MPGLGHCPDPDILTGPGHCLDPAGARIGCRTLVELYLPGLWLKRCSIPYYHNSGNTRAFAAAVAHGTATMELWDGLRAPVSPRRRRRSRCRRRRLASISDVFTFKRLQGVCVVSRSASSFCTTSNDDGGDAKLMEIRWGSARCKRPTGPRRYSIVGVHVLLKVLLFGGGRLDLCLGYACLFLSIDSPVSSFSLRILQCRISAPREASHIVECSRARCQA